jgi:UDP-N-acetylmuramyl pentapeptide phosphotransferase/UDP-N-acetylglucosamine-1-phosphate transferase
METFVITIVLFAIILIYFRIADRFNIIDKPNERSSHSTIILRGGGVIFPIAMLLFYFIYGIQTANVTYLWLMLSTLIISIVSFWDDVSSLPNKIRILIHLLSVSLLLYAVNAFSLLPIWLIFVVYVFIIGIINAYNFMDGINGITGVYSLSILISCFYFNNHVHSIVHPQYIIIPGIASLVFLFFNFRKKAKCFAGDVGSVSIGFWIISLILMMILTTGNYKYLFFLSVYGIDTILTIIHRLILKQNIFQAHRLHFYQILANEQKISQLFISIVYGLIQLGINAFILHTDYGVGMIVLCCCAPLSLVYILAKPRLMNHSLK